MQDGRREELAEPALLAPAKGAGKAAMANLARRILNRAAFPAHLQLESTERRGGREPQGGARAAPRGQQRLPRAQERVLGPRPSGRPDHASARPSTAAPE